MRLHHFVNKINYFKCSKMFDWTCTKCLFSNWLNEYDGLGIEVWNVNREIFRIAQCTGKNNFLCPESVPISAWPYKTRYFLAWLGPYFKLIFTDQKRRLNLHFHISKGQKTFTDTLHWTSDVIHRRCVLKVLHSVQYRLRCHWFRILYYVISRSGMCRVKFSSSNLLLDNV